MRPTFHESLRAPMALGRVLAPCCFALAAACAACGGDPSPAAVSGASSDAGTSVTDGATSSSDAKAAPSDISPADAIARAQAIVEGWCVDETSSDPQSCADRKAACLSGTPRTPYLTHDRAFACNSPGCSDFDDKGTYYLVPFDKADGTTPCIVAVARHLRGAEPGSFMVARSGSPIHYLPVGEEAAGTALTAHLATLGTPTPSALPAATLVDYPATAACGWSLDFPMWMFTIDSKTWFVDQQGGVTDEVTFSGAGGGRMPTAHAP